MPARTEFWSSTEAPAASAPAAPAPIATLPRAVPQPAVRRQWRHWHGQSLTVVAAIVAVALLLGAYRYTLTSLLRGVMAEPTLAWLVVVLPLSGLLAAFHARPGSQEPPIHDRQLDYLVGVPLLVAALAVVVLLPRQLSTLFWVYRIDVLALPLHASGLVALLFGTRALWRMRWAIGLLAVVWPVPWLRLTERFAERAPASETLLVQGPMPVGALVVPFVGVTALLLLAAMPVFRLRFGAPTGTGREPSTSNHAPAVRSLVVPLVIVMLASVTAAYADGRLERYAGVAGALGEPLTSAFVTEAPVLPGWAVVPDEGVSGPPQRERSTYRYELVGPSPFPSPAGAAPVLGVVVISAIAPLSGRAERPVDPSVDILPGGRTVELGEGVMADVVSSLDRETGIVTFTASWSLPVRDARGPRFERVAVTGEAPDGRHTRTAPIQDFVERVAREILRTQVAGAGTRRSSVGATT